MGRRRHVLGISVALVVTAALVPVAPALGAPSAAGGAKAKCPLGAIDKAGDEPVEVVFWHGTNRASEEALQRLADQFNASQTDVQVRLVNQTSYRDTIDKYRAGLSSGDLPDLVMIAETGLQQMIDSQSVLPAASCVKADKFDMSDHVKRVTEYYTVEGTLWPMPFNVAGPLLYYDKAAFRKAGLDPEKPPTNLDEVRAAAQTLKDTGSVDNAGFGFKLDPWLFEQWIAIGGKTVRQQQQRSQSARHQGAVRRQGRPEGVHVARRDGARRPGRDQRLRGARQHRQPPRHRDPQPRHDHRLDLRPGHDLAGPRRG